MLKFIFGFGACVAVYTVVTFAQAVHTYINYLP